MSERNERYQSFLGTGWSFPPRFIGGGVMMSADEADIHESLILLFGTTALSPRRHLSPLCSRVFLPSGVGCRRTKQLGVDENWGSPA